MARRSPGEIRRQLPQRRRHGRPPVIRGLSASTNRQISAFERSNSLPPGEVAHAFRRWVRSSNIRAPRDDADRSYVDWPEDWRHGDYHVRTVLEYATWALRRRARRELRDAILPLDDRYQARTVNNPLARQDVFWWLRRIDL